MPAIKEIRTWDKFFWAYCVDASLKAVLVRCESRQQAIEQKDAFKMCSDCKTVGCSVKKVDEMLLRKHCRQRGWKVSMIRGVA